MTREQIEHQKSLAIRICLQGHLHAIELGEKYGPSFGEHEYLSDAVWAIVMEHDLKVIMNMTESDGIKTMLGVVQRHEDLVMATLQEYFPELDSTTIVRQCSGFDQQLLTYLDEANSGRAAADSLSPAEEIQHELAKRGLADKVVVAMAKRGLRERIRERRQRRKWLHTSEGRAYMRDLIRRRHRHHHVDSKRSKVAHQAAKLYADERRRD